MSRGDLQPLGVLVEHRVDDVDERLVAVEQAVAAGQQVALEPALAEVLGEDLHDAPVGREVIVGCQPSRPPRRGRSPRTRRSEPVGRRLVGSHDAEVRRGLRRITSRRKPPSTRVASLVVAAGLGTSTACSRKSGISSSRSNSPPLACGLAPMRRSPAAPARPARRAARRARRTAPRGSVGAQPLPPAARGARALRARSESGTWWERNDPSAGSPSTTLGPGPALGGAQHDHRPARPVVRLARLTRSALDLRDLRGDLIERGGHQLVHRRRVVALDEVRRVAVALEQSSAAPRGGCARARWGWRSCSR